MRKRKWVPAKGQWQCSAPGKVTVGLASQCSCVTYFVIYPLSIYGLNGLMEKNEHPPTWNMATFNECVDKGVAKSLRSSINGYFHQGRNMGILYIWTWLTRFCRGLLYFIIDCLKWLVNCSVRMHLLHSNVDKCDGNRLWRKMKDGCWPFFLKCNFAMSSTSSV